MPSTARPVVICAPTKQAATALLAAARDAQGEQAPGWPVEDSAPVTLQQSDTGWVLTRHRAARVKALATRPDLPVVVAETLPDTGLAPRVLGLVLPADGTQSAARGFLSALLDDLTRHHARGGGLRDLVSGRRPRTGWRPGARPHAVLILDDALRFLDLPPLPFDQIDAWEMAQAGQWWGEAPPESAARPGAWVEAFAAMDASWSGRLEGFVRHLAALGIGCDVLPVSRTGFDRATGRAASDDTPPERQVAFNLGVLVQLLGGEARLARPAIGA